MRPLIYMLALSLLAGAALFAPPAAAADEMFKQAVFPPELVIRHQRKIGFSSEQRETFLREMHQTQADLLPVQLEMGEVGATLIQLLEEDRVDEEATLDAAMRMLELERRTKLRHMKLLIRIKNLLTTEQQTALNEIRDHDSSVRD